MVEGWRAPSCHEYYYIPRGGGQTITETYTKEVSVRPLSRSVARCPSGVRRRSPSPEGFYVHDEPDRYPYRRAREFPIVRIDGPERPGSGFSELFRETIDYEEYEKQTTQKRCPGGRAAVAATSKPKQPPPEVVVTSPTPRRRELDVVVGHPDARCGIPLQPVRSQIRESSREVFVEKLVDKKPIIPLPDGPPSKAPRRMRHIDSSSSSGEASDAENRVVYSHDVFVDAATGRPLDPQDALRQRQNCPRLKINVFFKPSPEAPGENCKYRLDEVEVRRPSPYLAADCYPLPDDAFFQKPFEPLCLSRDLSQHSLYRREEESLMPSEPRHENRDEELRRSTDQFDAGLKPMVSDRPPSRSSKQSIVYEKFETNEKRSTSPRPASRNSLLRKASEVSHHPTGASPMPNADLWPMYEPRHSKPQLVVESRQPSLHSLGVTGQPMQRAAEVRQSVTSFQQLAPSTRNSILHQTHLSSAPPQQQEAETTTSPRELAYDIPVRVETGGRHSPKAPSPLHKSSSYSRSSATSVEAPKTHHASGAHRESPGGRTMEEVVHVRERYERDETIRRFYPTTSV